MERDINYLIVGVVVALLIAAFVIFALWQAGTYDTRAFDRYTVYFDEDVSGLKSGSPVHYRGVQVGRVIDIRLAQDRPDLIKVDVELSQGTPVNSDTSARLKPQGITGISIIELRTERADAEPATPRAGERYPTVLGEPSQLDRLVRNLPRALERLIGIADRTEAFLSPVNAEHLSASLRNSARLSASLDTLTGEIRALTVRATRSLEGMDRVLVRTDTLVGDLNRQVTPGLSETLTHLSNLSARLDRITRTNEQSLLRATGPSLDELGRLIRDTRRTVGKLDALATRLNNEPSRLIFTPSPRGVEIAR